MRYFLNKRETVIAIYCPSVFLVASQGNDEKQARSQQRSESNSRWIVESVRLFSE